MKDFQFRLLIAAIFLCTGTLLSDKYDKLGMYVFALIFTVLAATVIEKDL